MSGAAKGCLKILQNRKKIFFVCQGRRSFFETDISILREHFQTDVFDLYPPSAAHIPGIWRGVSRADIVFIWFLGRHAVLPLIIARVLNKKIVLVAGGWDVADCPEINYGLMRNGPFHFLIKFLFTLPHKVLAVSQSNLREIQMNAEVPASKTELIYHGIEDVPDAGETIQKEKKVITAGEITRSNLRRKGLEAFVRCAARFTDVPFVLAGKDCGDGALEYLKSIAPANVVFTGFLSREELDRQMKSAAVYAQFSFHEAFGRSVAEAMLFECVPVVTDRGALPEVAGDAGYVVPYGDENAYADRILKALNDTQKGLAPRKRVLKLFSYEQRNDALKRLVDGL